MFCAHVGARSCIRAFEPGLGRATPSHEPSFSARPFFLVNANTFGPSVADGLVLSDRRAGWRATRKRLRMSVCR